MPTATLDTPTLTVTPAGDHGSPQAFAAAFQFLRSHSDGRYSDRTLMTVGRWEARSYSILDGRPAPDRVPAVLTLSTEVSYDEETEVKRGGTLACAVTLPSDGGFRSVLSVASTARRQGYGTELLRRLTSMYLNPMFWVGNGNREGQSFLLSCGLHPQRMNGSGAVLYARHAPDEEELVAR